MIEWEEISDDDFIATHGDFTLRVEQMYEDYWWCALYFKDTELAFGNFTTEQEAKKSIIESMTTTYIKTG